MSAESSNPDEPVITFKGADIRELPREMLIEAVRDGFSELVVLRQRLSEEGRMEAAREEDFQRELRDRRDFFGSAAEYQSRIFDASTAYNQIIVIGGYAAFFGVWSAFANTIDRAILVSSGFLVIVSLVVYVGWTVFGMAQLGRRNMEAIATFGGGVEGFAERIQAVEAESQRRSVNMLKFWRPIVWISALTGLSAATMLGGAALWALIPKASTPRPDPAALAVRAEAAAAKAECSARVTALYAQSRGGLGTTASNLKTGEEAVLVRGKWAILPRC